MAKNKTDLRVIKTNAIIKSEFMELLKKKPVEKITVKELAENALINKGTFYLHYQDIYALYEEVIHDVITEFCDAIDFYEDFFVSPVEFATKLMNQLKLDPLEKFFPYLDPLSTKVPIPVILADELKKKLYQLRKLPPSITNDIKLEYVLLSLFTISFRYGQNHFDEAANAISFVIDRVFAEK